MSLQFNHAAICPARPYKDDTPLQSEPFVVCCLEWQASVGMPDPAPEARRIGLVSTCIKTEELFKDERKTTDALLAGVEHAARCGARCISFVGMLPSATRFLTNIRDAIRDRGSAAAQECTLTTGHGVTVAAFALNLQELLDLTRRTISDEQVAVVGCGSIGKGIAEALLALGKRPKSMDLVDLEAKRPQLEQLQGRLADKYGYSAVQVHSVSSPASMIPNNVLANATVLLTAVGGGKVMDFNRLRPGAIVVDDSYPFGFDGAEARARIAGTGDVLLTIAGGIKGAEPYEITNGVDHVVQQHPPEGSKSRFRTGWQIVSVHPLELTGCIYSSMLTPKLGLPPVIGPVTVEAGLETYKLLRDAGFKGTHPYFLGVGSGPDEGFVYSIGQETVAKHVKASNAFNAKL